MNNAAHQAQAMNRTLLTSPNYALLCAVAFTYSAAGVSLDITRPTDTIQLVNGVNDADGNAGPPPAQEGVERAIDNFGQKYLNFLDLGSGLAVQPGVGATIVTGLRLYTANDALQRDPASFILSGSDSLSGPWTEIASGPLALPDTRNAGGNAISIPDEGNLAAAHQEITFANSSSFLAYQLIFPTLKDAAAANSMQIAEVELLGIIGSSVADVPDSGSSLLLAATALVTLGGFARGLRRKV
jgi:hypothetical protein